MSKIINFNCELECGGKCCSGVTHILPSEIKYLMNKAPIIPNYFVINKKTIKDKELLKNLKRSSVNLNIENKITHKKDEVILFIDFIFGSWKNTKDCMLLVDGKCSLHNSNKPLKCQLLPIQPLISEKDMWYAYDTLRKTCIGVKPLTEKKYMVWEKDRFVGNNEKKKLKEYYDSLEKNKEFLLKLYLSHIASNENREKLVYDLSIKDKQGESNNSFETTFIPIKELLDLIDIDVDDFVNSQIVAFEKFINHDVESYNESKNLQLQYKMLKTFKENKTEIGNYCKQISEK